MVAAFSNFVLLDCLAPCADDGVNDWMHGMVELLHAPDSARTSIWDAASWSWW